jgi:hypothetical protein
LVIRFQLGGHFPRTLSLVARAYLEHFSWSRVGRDTGATNLRLLAIRKRSVR